MKRVLKLLLVVGMVFLLSAEMVEAQCLSCYRPEPPYCLHGIATFDDEYSFNRCKSEMESYLTEVEMYSSCLLRAARSEASQVQMEADEAIDRFNCRARGDVICP